MKARKIQVPKSSRNQNQISVIKTVHDKLEDHIWEEKTCAPVGVSWDIKERNALAAKIADEWYDQGLR